MTGEVDLKVRNAPPSFRSDIGTFPFDPSTDPQINLWRIFFIISDLSFSFMGKVNIQIAAFVHDIEHEKLNKIPEKNRPLRQNLVFNAGIQVAESMAGLIYIRLMRKWTNSDCRFWVDLRRR